MAQADCAGTLVNICTLLSSLGKHQEALVYAKQAIAKLKCSEDTTACLAYYNCGVEAEYLALWD